MAWGQREGGDVAMVYCGELIPFVSYLPRIQTTEKELAFRNQLDLIPSHNLLSLVHELLNPERLVPLAKLFQQPPPRYLIPFFPTVELLQAEHEPARFFHVHAPPLHHLPLHQHQSLLFHQLQMHGDGRVRLAELSPELILG